MPYESTIAGSLPKPRWLASDDQLWAGWRLDGDTLREAQLDAVRLVVADQENAGLDIVTDGEQTRQHFVTTFIEGLDGVDAINRATVHYWQMRSSGSGRHRSLQSGSTMPVRFSRRRRVCTGTLAIWVAWRTSWPQRRF